MTEEHKRKIGIALKGIPKSDIAKKNMSPIMVEKGSATVPIQKVMKRGHRTPKMVSPEGKTELIALVVPVVPEPEVVKGNVAMTPAMQAIAKKVQLRDNKGHFIKKA